MKKAIITILAACIILCSCNIDSDVGIFSEIVDSEEGVKINTKAYLGQKSTEPDVYYYLTDTGIYKTGSGEAIYSCSDGIIDYAALVNDTLLVLRKDGTLTIDDGSNVVDDSEKYSKLLPNGFLYRSDNKVCLFNGTAVQECDAIGAGEVVNSLLWSENHALVLTSRYDETLSKNVYTNYIFNGTSIDIQLESNSSRCSGFQVTGDATYPYALIKYDADDEAFKAILVKTDSTTEEVELKSNLEYLSSAQCPTFCYTLDSKLYIAVKTASYFDIVDIAEKNVESTRDGFAESIRTANVCNIMKTSTDGVFIAATWNGFLYIITINETTNEAVQIN